jgi:hypothetical protein
MFFFPTLLNAFLALDPRIHANFIRCAVFPLLRSSAELHRHPKLILFALGTKEIGQEHVNTGTGHAVEIV